MATIFKHNIFFFYNKNKRSRNLFWKEYKNMANKWFLFYNREDDFEEIAYFKENYLTVFNEKHHIAAIFSNAVKIVGNVN